MVHRLIVVLIFGCMIGINMQAMEDFEEDSDTLHDAVKYGHLGTVSGLCKEGVDVNMCDGDNNTPLGVLVQSRKGKFSPNDVTILNVLLAHEADVNMLDRNGCTPLIYAVKFNNPEVVWLLLEAGASASFKVKDKYGKSALDYMQLDSSPQRTYPSSDVEFAAKVEARKKKALAIQYFLSKAGGVKMSSLIDYGRPNYFGVDFDVSQERDTALMIAIKTGQIADVEKLCFEERGTINASDKTGYSPLVLAIGKDRLDCVSLLLKNGATFDDVDKNGCTVLMYAVEKGNVEIVEALLKASPDLNQQNSQHQTALMVAAKKGNVEIVKALLKAGADLNQQNSQHQTALMVAAQGGQDQVVELLLNKESLGDCINTKDKLERMRKALVLAAAVQGDSGVRIVKMLLEAEAKIKTQDEEIKTQDEEIKAQEEDGLVNFHHHMALCRATVYGNVDIVKALLLDAEVKATINCMDMTDNVYYRSSKGKTPLIYAILCEKGELANLLVNLLLEAGANVDEKSDSGNTPLIEAVKRASSNEELISSLLKAGANVNAKCAESGETALEIAISKSRYQAARLLIEFKADVTKIDPLVLTNLTAAPQPLAPPVAAGPLENLNPSFWSSPPSSTVVVSVSVALSVLLAVGVYVFWDKIGLKRA